jgi:hypothetical protein
MPKRQPRVILVTRSFEPDVPRQLRALRIVLGLPPEPLLPLEFESTPVAPVEQSTAAAA